jgi:hypothetical protein
LIVVEINGVRVDRVELGEKDATRPQDEAI